MVEFLTNCYISAACCGVTHAVGDSTRLHDVVVLSRYSFVHCP
jgi:hypothetical protein